MDDRHPPLLVDATADNVLAIIRDNHRLQCCFDPEADIVIELTRDSTVADWRQACDLIAPKPLGRALNKSWAITLSDEAWRAVLVPTSKRRLGEVCDLIAAHAQVRHIRPAMLLGKECLTAGAFLTVRSCLADAGANIDALGPSTLLHEYTRRYAGIFLNDVARLVPGRLPTVTVHAPVQRALIAAFALSLVTAFFFPPAAGLALFCFMLLCIGWLAQIPPARVQFEGLYTFADLARVMAGERSRTRNVR